MKLEWHQIPEGWALKTHDGDNVFTVAELSCGHGLDCFVSVDFANCFQARHFVADDDGLAKTIALRLLVGLYEERLHELRADVKRLKGIDAAVRAMAKENEEVDA